MTKIINAIWDTLKAGGDWYIIWITGPDGTLFDLLSILKIIGSGLALIGPLCHLIKTIIKWREWQ